MIRSQSGAGVSAGVETVWLRTAGTGLRCVVASLRPCNEQFIRVVGTPVPHSLDDVGERAADRAEFQQRSSYGYLGPYTCTTGQVFSIQDIPLLKLVIHQYKTMQWEHICWVRRADPGPGGMRGRG